MTGLHLQGSPAFPFTNMKPGEGGVSISVPAFSTLLGELAAQGILREGRVNRIPLPAVVTHWLPVCLVFPFRCTAGKAFSSLDESGQLQRAGASEWRSPAILQPHSLMNL